MAQNSNIEWTHHTFNPWRGCTKVSQGCKHCYAETLSKRNPAALGQWGPKGQRVIAAESYWAQPLKWDKAAKVAGERHRVFCASMADVFEGPESMPAESWPLVEAARARLFNLILDTPHLDWLLLTKRPQKIKPQLQAIQVLKYDNVWDHLWPHHFPNVWIGTSVENQATADERIPHLLSVPAKVRFLSMEPLLSSVDLSSLRFGRGYDCTPGPTESYDPLGNIYEGDEVIGISCEPGIHWVIVGGESGANARPMHPQWVRSLRDQCNGADVPFFFKQWGEELPKGQGNHDLDERGLFRRESHVGGQTYYRVGKKAAGRLLDGREWNEVPS
jgi:protein gp37